MGLDNGNSVEHGYGAEGNRGTVGGRAQQCHIEGRRCGDVSKCSSVGAHRAVVDGWVVVSGQGAR